MGDVDKQDRGIAELIAACVAIELGVVPSDIFSKHKGLAEHSYARQMAMYLMHVVFNINLSRVSRAFQRDRSTVSYACNLIEDARDDRALDERLTQLEAFLVTAPLPQEKRRA